MFRLYLKNTFLQRFINYELGISFNKIQFSINKLYKLITIHKFLHTFSYIFNIICVQQNIKNYLSSMMYQFIITYINTNNIIID